MSNDIAGTGISEIPFELFKAQLTYGFKLAPSSELLEIKQWIDNELSNRIR